MNNKFILISINYNNNDHYIFINLGD